MNVITKVEPDSIAQEMGIEIKDTLISIDGQPVADIFDYRFKIRSEYLEMLIKKPSGEEWLLEIDKEEYEELGLDFVNPLMDKEKTCTNKCVFCFIDQNPKGMRETIYFKDDDSRLSFLDGNFVTLTNMKDEDIDRIISYRLSPINISVHASEPELRTFMLKNPRSALIMEQIKKITDAGLYTNFQVVLCKGINDGINLDRTISDLSSFLPYGQGLSVVPLGVTKFRSGLHPVQPYTPEECEAIIRQVEAWQEKIFAQHGTKFVFLADEFYIKAGRPLPNEAYYEEYKHIDNGIGMMRSFIDEFEAELKISKDKTPHIKEVSVITSTAPYAYLKELTGKLALLHDITIHVYPITNQFYGETITVSGLLTGFDIINQLKGQALGERILLPSTTLKNNDVLLLDNVTVADMSNALNTPVIPTNIHGGDFLNALLGYETQVNKQKTYG